jgi:hypothetical protein
VQPFDEIVVVDWSAASVPKLGRDSIWIATAKNRPLNFATRARATEYLRALLAKTRRALVGWDFPLGYPRGLARSLGGPQRRAWRFTWDLIASELGDADDNQNDRFALAASLNARLAKKGPFWGRPAAMSLSHLYSTRPFDYPVRSRTGIELAEYRHCEVELRADPLLAPRSRIWPFETRFAREIPDGPLIVHAEAWPSAIPLNARAHSIKDAAQVVTLARHLARIDLRAALGPKLARQIERGAIEEEGWVLG